MSHIRPQTLSEVDAILLRWYFGPGASVFERSAFGGMLDRACMFNAREAEDARYFEWRREFNQLSDIVGVGVAGTELGFERQITARITCEVTTPPKNEGDETDLMDAAKASRGLQRLQAIHRQGFTVMALVFGPGSEVWAVKGFPLGGLYQLLESGKKLIAVVLKERAASTAKGMIQLPHLLHNDYAAAVHNLDGDRVAMHGAAEGAAERLLGQVSSVWVDLHRKG